MRPSARKRARPGVVPLRPMHSTCNSPPGAAVRNRLSVGTVLHSKGRGMRRADLVRSLQGSHLLVLHPAICFCNRPHHLQQQRPAHGTSPETWAHEEARRPGAPKRGRGAAVHSGAQPCQCTATMSSIICGLPHAMKTHWNLRACTSPLRMAKRRFDSSVSRAELTLKRGSFLQPVCLEECDSRGQHSRAVPLHVSAASPTQLPTQEAQQTCRSSPGM